MDKERLARALYEAAPVASPIGGEQWSWEWLVENKWAIVGFYKDAVNFILADISAQGFVIAPREPTEALCVAGIDAILGYEREHEWAGTAAKEVYTAMIHAIEASR